MNLRDENKHQMGAEQRLALLQYGDAANPAKKEADKKEESTKPPQQPRPSNLGLDVRNLGEVELFELENKMRKGLCNLIDPLVAQQNRDREEIVKFESVVRALENKVYVLENILFEKDESGRMQLFDRVFSAIKDVDQQRIIEEQAIHQKLDQTIQNLEEANFKLKNGLQKLEIYEEQLLELNQNVKNQSDATLDWQNKFLEKFSENEMKMHNQLSDMEKTLSRYDLKLIRQDQRVGALEAQGKVDIKMLEQHQERLDGHKAEIIELQATKVPIKVFEEERLQLHADLSKLREQAENNGNHFAMVENYVEKYLPVRIQGQISETLQQALDYKETARLVKYEKAKFMELHAVILMDDGVPRLYERIKDIRFELDNIDFKNYQGLMLARTKDGQSVSFAGQAHEPPGSTGVGQGQGKLMKLELQNDQRNSGDTRLAIISNNNLLRRKQTLQPQRARAGTIEEQDKEDESAGQPHAGAGVSNDSLLRDEQEDSVHRKSGSLEQEEKSLQIGSQGGSSARATKKKKPAAKQLASLGSQLEDEGSTEANLELLKTNKVVKYLEQEVEKLQARLEAVEKVALVKMEYKVDEARKEALAEVSKLGQQFDIRSHELKTYIADLHKELQHTIQKKRLEHVQQVEEVKVCLKRLDELALRVEDEMRTNDSFAVVLACIVEKLQVDTELQAGTLQSR